MTDRLLTVDELSDILRVSKRTIYNQICRKASRRFPIPVLRVLGQKAVRFRLTDVEAYIHSLVGDE